MEDVESTIEDQPPASTGDDNPLPSPPQVTQTQPDSPQPSDTQTDQKSTTNDEVSQAADDFNSQHLKNVHRLQTIPNTAISSLNRSQALDLLFTYSVEKCIKFVGPHYGSTPIYLLKRLVLKAREILNGLSNETILDDDKTLNDMALLDESTILGLDKCSVDEFLSTYARQYGIQVEETYYSKTSIEQKRIQLIKSTDEYKSEYLKTEPTVTLNENTTNQMIDFASLNMTRMMLENYVKTFNVDIGALEIEKMDQKTIVTECIKIRDSMRIAKNLPPLPHSQRHKFPSKFDLNVGNKNGNLFSKFLPKLSSHQTRKQLANNKAGQQAHMFEQNDFYVRVNAPVKGKNVHIPTVIKLVFGKLRQADPSFTIMPFDRNDTTKNATIAKEDAIPKDKKDLHTWVRGDYITKNNRLLYSMRCTNNVPFRDVRALLNAWQQDTGIKVNFDSVVSKSLFPAGWLKFAHPRLINRDSLFHWMIQQSNDKQMKSKLHLYPRVMFEYRQDGTKALTEVLVIDGAYDHKKTVKNFLLNMKWNGYYSNVEFIPFQATDENDKQNQIDAIDSHNEYCSKLTSEIITIKRPDYVLSDTNGNKHTFVDWLATQKQKDVPIFYEVEQIGVTKILLVYFDHHTEIVTNFLTNVYEMFLQEFFSEIADVIFGIISPSNILRSAPRQTNDFFKRLKNISANPQHNDDDSLPQQRVNAFYGQEPLETTSDEAELFGSKSYKTAATNSSNESSEVVRLTRIVNDLRDQVESLSQSIATEVTTSVMKDVEVKLEAIEERLNDNIQAVRDECNDKIVSIESRFDEIWNKIDLDNKTLLAAIEGRPKPPSGDAHSARGAAK